MQKIVRDFFIALSNNKVLNKGAKRWGLRLGADQFVAGQDLESTIETVKLLNKKGISCTIDHLGEFITDETESVRAKEMIINALEKINEEQIKCHLSVKLTQLGLDINETFCLNNMIDIVRKAYEYNIFVNIDTEDYAHYEKTLHILNVLRKTYDNVGIVIQSYLFRAEEDMNKLTDVRLRIVKGAYKENESVAYQSKEKIDENFLKLVKKRLKGTSFTSIATHDHNLIEDIKKFVDKENIDKRNFEFQMLYGFRTEMQKQLAKDGYLFCTYIPFGDDWYGYFMRRLAERPQNINLILKDKFYTNDHKLKKKPFVVTAIMTTVLYLLLRKGK